MVEVHELFTFLFVHKHHENSTMTLKPFLLLIAVLFGTFVASLCIVRLKQQDGSQYSADPIEASAQTQQLNSPVRVKFGAQSLVQNPQDECGLSDAQLFDCDPNPNTTAEQCESLGCCWNPSEHSKSRIIY